MKKMLGMCVLCATRYPWTVVACCVLLTALSFVPASRVLQNVDSDLARLMPPDLPATATMHEVRTQLGAVDVITVLVKLAPDLPGITPLPWEDAHADELVVREKVDLTMVGDEKSRLACERYLVALGEYRRFRRQHRRAPSSGPDGIHPESYLRVEAAYDAAEKHLRVPRQELLWSAKKYLSLFADELSESLLIQSIDFRTNTSLGLACVDHFGERLVYYLEQSELDELARRMTAGGLAERVASGRAILQEEGAQRFREQFLRDPLGLADLAARRTERYAMRAGHDDEGYIVAEDRSLALAIVRGTRPVLDLPYSKEIVAEVRGAADRAWIAFREKWPEHASAADEMYVEFAGNYAIAVHENESMLADIRYTFLLSLGGVLVLFVLVYRRVSTGVIVALPLIASVSWTLGVAGLLFERISVLSGAFGAVLLGLGIDYAIHIYGRFTLEYVDDVSTVEAVQRAVLASGPGIVMGALTTAAAFFGITVARFRALSELGVLAGTGVLFAAVAMVLVMPAMLVLMQRRGGDHRRPTPLWPEWIWSSILVRPRFFLSVVATATVVSIIFVACSIDRAFIDFDFQKLRSADNPAFEANQLVNRRFGTSLQRIICVSRAETVAKALDAARALRRDLEPLCGRTIGKVDSVLGFVPAPSSQKKVAEFLRDNVDVDLTSEYCALACKEAGFAARVARDIREHIERLSLLGVEPEYVTVAEAESIDGMAPLLSRYIASGPAHDGPIGPKVITFLYPTMRVKDYASFGRLYRELGPDRYERSFTSPDLVSLELRTLLGQDVLVMCAVVSSLIAAALMVNLYPRNRRVLVSLGTAARRSLLVLIPTVVACAWVLAFMVAADWSLNQFNIVILPMILGIGIDDGIHLVHEFGRHGEVNRTMRAVGGAIVMTSVTSAIGFGALMVARSRALFSLGSLAALGVLCCMISSLVVLPALLSLMAKRATIERPRPLVRQS